MCQSLLGKNSWESTTFHGVQHWMSSLQLDASYHTHPDLRIVFENPTKNHFIVKLSLFIFRYHIFQFMPKLINKIFNYKKDHIFLQL